MSLYTAVVANVLFPLHELAKAHSTVAVRRALDESEWWSAEQLECFRIARLKRLLGMAGKHVPYYQDLFSRLAFSPDSLASTADLRQLPLLTKSTIRSEGDRMQSEMARHLMRYNTGGSSGEPLVFFIGKERVTHDVAAKWRATRWWGVDIGDPEIVVWGSPIELGAQDRVRALRDAVMRTELLPAFAMSEARLDGFVARIRRRRPRMLFGYPSAISHIADHARRRGVRLDDLGVKVVFVTSERLYDYQRTVIAETFGCPVANGYGGRDAGFIAHECPQGSLHITAEDIIVEIVDAAGNPVPVGEEGEIVVTHLATPEFPFVRYRTGDIGRLTATPCRCGRGLPVLAEIQGRTTDFVVAADGTVMHGLAVIYPVRDLPEVAGFKIVQESLSLTRVEVVAGAGFGADTVAKIQTGLRARLGAAVEIQVEPVLEILPERSGKHRYVVSRVVS